MRRIRKYDTNKMIKSGYECRVAAGQPQGGHRVRDQGAAAAGEGGHPRRPPRPPPDGAILPQPRGGKFNNWFCHLVSSTRFNTNLSMCFWCFDSILSSSNPSINAISTKPSDIWDEFTQPIIQVRTMPVDWHGVRHTVVTYSNVDEMALLEQMLQGSK